MTPLAPEAKPSAALRFTRTVALANTSAKNQWRLLRILNSKQGAGHVNQRTGTEHNSGFDKIYGGLRLRLRGPRACNEG